MALKLINHQSTYERKMVLVKLQTGIKGLDLVLNGGIPAGRGLLVVGGPGTGKTVLLSEFLYRGITEYRQNGVFVTFEERPHYIWQNVQSFGWDFERLTKNNKLLFVDASPNSNYVEISDVYDLVPLLERIKYAVRKINAQRVVIDGIGNLFQKFSNKRMIREVIYNISDELKRMGISFIISAEKSQAQDFSVEEYVSDGVIKIARDEKQGRMIRNLEVLKMRGMSYVTGKIFFEISDNGLEIYPKIDVSSLPYKRRSGIRYKFGISEFDKALGGGLPEGSNTVFVGGAGTGKAILGLQFLREGFRKNQNGLYITFKDSEEVIENISDRFGWNFRNYFQNGKLHFYSASQHPDKLIYTITEMVEKHKIKRVVMDSLAFVDPTIIYPEKTTEFYFNLMLWFRRRGITCLLSYPTAKNDFVEESSIFSGNESPLLRVLNAVPDGIIALRSVVDQGQIIKQLSILKLRNTDHRKEIFNYELGKYGFRLRKPVDQLTV